VTGFLTDTRGGPPLGGALVAVEGTPLTATTGADGAFSIADVPAGTRSLLITRAGYGAGRLQGVAVAEGATTEVRALLRPVFDASRPIAAPTITVTGLTPGATISGTAVVFTVSVSAANPVRLIQWRFGHRGDIPNGSASDISSVTVTWNTTHNASGPNFVNIIAYDNNWNVAEWSIPVTVANPGGTAPDAPTSVFATAVTFGRPLNVFTAQRQVRANRMAAMGRDPSVVPLRDGRYLDIKAAPPDSTLFVYVLWTPMPGAVGYKVYRSFSPEGPFVLLADARGGVSAACATLAFGGMTRCHRDSSADLAVGRTVYYKVRSYNLAAESALSVATAHTTPLAVFNLNLTSPLDEFPGIAPGSTPTFTWTPTAAVGTTRSYLGYVWGVNDGSPSYLFCTTATSLTFGGDLCPGTTVTPLQRAKRYEWDIYYALAYTSYGAAGDAYSMAGFPWIGPGFPMFSSGSLNGPFFFTTTP
jgi:hypothetical protein